MREKFYRAIEGAENKRARRETKVSTEREELAQAQSKRRSREKFFRARVQKILERDQALGITREREKSLEQAQSERKRRASGDRERNFSSKGA